MSNYLCTFPGKYGDILWSLPTAKVIAERIVGKAVDFAVMPYYESILPLLREQTYIDRAYVIDGWLRTHSNYGDQPWQPQDAKENVGIPDKTVVTQGVKSGTTTMYSYEKVWHLGYRCHPGRAFGNVELPLIDFVAHQQGITFNDWSPVPFISLENNWANKDELDFGTHIVLALNEQYADQKNVFKTVLAEQLNGITSVLLLDSSISWPAAARLIRDAVLYVGDRSANWVIAQGMEKDCITFEPHPSRHQNGHLGKVFGNPYGKEIALPFGMPAGTAGEAAASMVKQRLERIKQESCVATNQT